MSKSHDTKIDTHVAYAVGHCESWLDTYARSIPTPGAEFTYRVASSLLSQTGPLLGLEGNLPSLPGQAAQRDQAVEPLAVARGTHQHSPHENYERAVINRKKGHGAKKYWDSLSPWQKKKRLRNMLAARRAKKENK